MYNTSDLKRGLILELDGAPHLVESVQVSTPSARGATTIHKVRMRNLKTRQKVDRSFRGGDTFGVPDVDRRSVQFLYRDPEAFHFMDEENYDTGYSRRVGQRLRAIRRQKRLSLQEVETSSAEEFKASVLGAYERGERSISVPRLQRLARFYNVPVDQLLPPDGPDFGV